MRRGDAGRQEHSAPPVGATNMAGSGQAEGSATADRNQLLPTERAQQPPQAPPCACAAAERNYHLGLNLGVYYKAFNVENKQLEERKELSDTLEAIRVSTQKLQFHIFHVWRFYNFTQMQKASDSFLLESNYINWWLMVQSCAIFLSQVLQLYFLKRLFKQKY
ncbi:transmembrane emp24 domain-containing protein 6 [Strigops habroptila]|uniref:transmembrane emp24 domain-containing protein 6 n=1 Tax=Strigops habroptila TaxID=2489341 RepID=UPI0011D002A0|nr:transmembrane emp24 domain-containing protein 6 [Strigops habroptila]